LLATGTISLGHDLSGRPLGRGRYRFKAFSSRLTKPLKQFAAALRTLHPRLKSWANEKRGSRHHSISSRDQCAVTPLANLQTGAIETDLIYDMPCRARLDSGIRMKYYTVAEIDINDPTWVRSYAETVTTMVERHGGRYLARTSNFEKIEGDRPRPQVFLLIEWPTREAAMTFYESEEYAPFRRSRIKGAKSEMSLVAGEDVSRRARILE